MVYAIIAAGGTGTRFGYDKPKQFYVLGEKTVLETTAEKFDGLDIIEKVIVACPCEWAEYTRELLCGMRKVQVIQGGETRNETVMNAIDFIEKNYGLDENTLVVTHDAVRPFVTQEMIVSGIEKALECGASVAAVQAVDTVIESKDGKYVFSVPDRKTMFHVQTPQTFRAVQLKELYNSLTKEEKERLTDCSGIFLLRGQKVGLCEGDMKNIKITFRSDVEQ